MEFIKFISQDVMHFLGFTIVLGMCLTFILKAILIAKGETDVDPEL